MGFTTCIFFRPYLCKIEFVVLYCSLHFTLLYAAVRPLEQLILPSGLSVGLGSNGQALIPA
jgi:hypothetical protein